VIQSQRRVVGVARLKLKQGRFGNGALYVSALLDAGELFALDVRFFVEKDKVVTPTPTGFRVPVADLDTVARLVERAPDQVGELVLWSRQKRKLVARRCEGKYGVGVDIRHYKSSAEYEGWEKRGIRLVDEDFSKLMAIIRRSGLLTKKFKPPKDLFEGWELAGSRDAHGVPRRGGPREKAGPTVAWSTPVALALEEFLRGA
jgi:hypothetical protein